MALAACAIVWRQDGAVWREEQLQSSEPGAVTARALEAGRVFSTRFTSPAGPPERLEMLFGTYCRINTGRLSCTLQDTKGRTLASSTLDLLDLEDNAYRTIFDLAGVSLSPRTVYRIDFHLEAAPGNEVALYVGARPAGLTAGRRQPLMLDPDRPHIAAVVTDRLPRYRVEWSGRDARWATWPTLTKEDEGRFEPYQLKAGEVFAFDMVAPSAGAVLSVQIGTYQKRVDGFLITELCDRAGTCAAYTVTDLATVMDNEFVPVLSVNGNVLEPGRKYSVRLHWLGKVDKPIALYAAPVSAGHYELKRHLEELSCSRYFAEKSRARAELAPMKVVVVAADDRLDRPGLLIEAVGAAFPGVHYDVVAFEEAANELDVLRGSDVVVFVDVFQNRCGNGLDFDELCFDLHRNRVCTIFLDSENRIAASTGRRLPRSMSSLAGHRLSHARRCHYVLNGRDRTSLHAAQPSLLPKGAREISAPEMLRLCVGAVRAASMPHVCFVSVLHRKADSIGTFLDRIYAQDYPGLITVVLVDDASPHDDVVRAREAVDRHTSRAIANRRVVFRHNEENLGNCTSRLLGLATEDADIYVIIDSDCLINRHFVAAHAFEHWWDDVDAVIGPLNIESRGRDVSALIQQLEADPFALSRESDMQDPVLAEAFVNCITRNFSIKRRHVVDGDLFDSDFSYSARPDSGFGWEDVEMGYRLYTKGAVIRFTTHAFSVHVSHASSIAEDAKILGSTRNFARLFQKHPDLALVSRRWANETYGNIVRWQEGEGVPSGSARQKLDTLFSASYEQSKELTKGLRGRRKRLRILTYRWHVPHQYELYKLPHNFTLVTGLGSPATDVWSYDQRPLRPNARLVPFGNIDPRDYDVVLLHFDENVMAAHICNGVIPASWGDAFRRLLEIKDLPKVAICHGTVPFEGQFGLVPDLKSHFEPHEDERRALVDVLARADVRVVCNSYQAEAEWGFAQSRVIWHGFDPQEFPRGTLERDVLALAADFNRPHYRGAWEFEAAVGALDAGIAVESAKHPGASIDVRSGSVYATRNFRSYVDRIRSFKFYLNTTLRSPMPRSRGEAMMTGVIPVCMRNHDVDRFIENGVDGFYSDQPEDLAAFINDTIRDTGRLRAMSDAARRKAMDVFNHDLYLGSWLKLLDEVAR